MKVKKKTGYTIIMLLYLFTLAGCGNSMESSNIDNVDSISESKTVDIGIEETDNAISDGSDANETKVLIDNNPDVTAFFNGSGNLKSYKDELSPDFKEETGEEKEINGGYVYVTKKYNETRSYEEQVVFTKSDIIYPGAVFRGDALLNNEYIPINLPRKSMDISLSLQGSAFIKGNIENPRVISSAREAINNMLNQDGLEGPASLSFHVSEIESANQFSVELGPGIGIQGVELGFGITSAAEFEKSMKFAQFEQRYYSITADRPQFVSDFFDSSVTRDQIMEASNGYMPVYVSNVIYGRRGIFELNTEYDSETLENEFSIGYGIDGIGVSAEVKDAVTTSMKTSDMKLYILGGNGDSAVQSINSYDAFVNHIQSGGHFSSDNRGEIIGFELRYLNDDSIAKTVINESYSVVEKIPRNRTITYDVSYIDAHTDADTFDDAKVDLSNFSIFMDADNIPLWDFIYSSASAVTTIYKDRRASFKEIMNARTSNGFFNSGEEYFTHVKKKKAYSNPATDTAQFDVSIGGNFATDNGGMFGYKTNSFTYSVSQSFNIKDIENDGVIVLNVTGDSNPAYNFDIGIEVNVEYEE